MSIAESPPRRKHIADDSTNNERHWNMVAASPVCREPGYFAMLAHLAASGRGGSAAGKLETLDGVPVPSSDRGAEEIQAYYVDAAASASRSPLARHVRARECGGWPAGSAAEARARQNLREAQRRTVRYPAVTAECPGSAFRPRQFEYHPTDPRLLSIGTVSGEVLLHDRSAGRLVARWTCARGATAAPSTPPHGPAAAAPAVLPSHHQGSVLGLCWLTGHPHLLLTGSDGGCLQLLDTRDAFGDTSAPIDPDAPAAANVYESFEQLTSVHADCTSTSFLASGYSPHVSLYRLDGHGAERSRRAVRLRHVHQLHVNVTKFSHRHPHIFLTSSFDKSVKLWDLRVNHNVGTSSDGASWDASRTATATFLT